MKHPLVSALLLVIAGRLFAVDPAPPPRFESKIDVPNPGLATPLPPPAEPAKVAAPDPFAAGLKPQKGPIVLHGGLARVVLPETLRYLDPADTATVLTKIWGNPSAAGAGTLGMLVPAGFDPTSDNSWAVIITFEEDGYVKDDDAASIDYPKMLADMKERVLEANAEREKQGFKPIELVGWAKPPRYDATAKKLYWAKELKFGQAHEHTLNYNIRMLGRRGVLVLNAVAGMHQLADVEAATPSILAAVNFADGHRYADFNGDTDKVATYGIAALVAGGIAAKAGFFKLLWVGLLAFKKIIIVAVIVLGSQFKKLLAWIRGRQTKSAFTAPTGGDVPPPPAAS